MVGLGVKCGEILIGDQASVVLRKRGHAMRERAFVEIIANGAELGLPVARGFLFDRCKRTQRASEGRLAEDFGAIGSGSAGEKEIPRGGQKFEEALIAANEGGKLLGDGESGGGVLDSGRGHFRERHGSITRESEDEAVKNAG